MRFALLISFALLASGCGSMITTTKTEFKTVGASIGATTPPMAPNK